MVTVSRAEDLDVVESLLRTAELPTADVRSGPGRFVVAREDSEVVGAGGFEPYGSDGLLRSLVVRGEVRGRGYGTALCEELEARAAAAGVRTLYLLTTGAAGFFEGRGYERMARETAPDRIRATTQFAELCPSSATCMRKGL